MDHSVRIVNKIGPRSLHNHLVLVYVDNWICVRSNKQVTARSNDASPRLQMVLAHSQDHLFHWHIRLRLPHVYLFRPQRSHIRFANSN